MTLRTCCSREVVLTQDELSGTLHTSGAASSVVMPWLYEPDEREREPDTRAVNSLLQVWGRARADLLIRYKVLRIDELQCSLRLRPGAHRTSRGIVGLAIRGLLTDNHQESSLLIDLHGRVTGKGGYPGAPPFFVLSRTYALARVLRIEAAYGQAMGPAAHSRQPEGVRSRRNWCGAQPTDRRTTQPMTSSLCSAVEQDS